MVVVAMVVAALAIASWSYGIRITTLCRKIAIRRSDLQPSDVPATNKLLSKKRLFVALSAVSCRRNPKRDLQLSVKKHKKMKITGRVEILLTGPEDVSPRNLSTPFPPGASPASSSHLRFRCPS